MKGYASCGAITPAGTSQTLIALIGTATKAVRLIGIQFGCSATPADNAALFQVKRFTAKGTAGGSGTCYYNNAGLGLTPDVTVEKATYSVEPTYVAGSGYEIVINQRATFWWRAPEEMWAPAGASAGWGLFYASGPLVAWDIIADFEQ